MTLIAKLSTKSRRGKFSFANFDAMASDGEARRDEANVSRRKSRILFPYRSAMHRDSVELEARSPRIAANETLTLTRRVFRNA